MNISEFNKYSIEHGAKYIFVRGEDNRKVRRFQIKKACKDLKKRNLKYGDTVGNKRLISLISEKEDVNENNILILQGSTLGIFYYFLMIKHEELIIFKPYYPLYFLLADMFNINKKIIDLANNNYDLTFDFFIKNITKKTKYIIINNPNNPTGKVYLKEEMEKIIKYCEDNKIYLLLDYVYERLIYENSYLNSYKNEKYIIYLKSFSKSYNLTGVRIAYLLANKEIICLFKQFLANSLVSLPLINQGIAYSSLKKDKIYVLKRYKKNRLILKQFLEKNNLNYIALEGTYYAFINIEKYAKSSFDFVLELLEKKFVALLPGECFGDDKYVRFSYMTSSSYLKKGLALFQEFLDEKYFKSLT